MKKRILAIVLACLMLVSVLPTSAFAVEHTHADVKCPGATAGTDGHNKTNCDYTELNTVPPVCGELGYTLYECNGCHTHFIADTTYGEGGSHEYGELIPAVAPDCGAKKDGTIAHYKCGNKLCGKYFDENKVEVDSIVDPWKHTWVANNGDEVDCTKNGMVCATCGATKAVEANHKWGKVEIKEYPTTTTAGRAVEKCTNEGCTVSRDILIEEQCIHPADTLTKVEGKPATCLEGGWIEHYTCKECSEAAGQTVYLLASKGDITRYLVVTKAMVTLDALGHDYGSNPLVERLPDPTKPACHPDNAEAYGTKYCNNCKKDVDQGKLNREHRLEYVDRDDPTCQTWGADHYICKTCGVIKTEALEPIAHNYTSTVVTEATCLTAGVMLYTCTNKWQKYDEEGNWDGVTYETCGHSYTKAIEAKGHATKDLQLDSTCMESGWSLSFCTRDNCNLPLVTEVDGGVLITDLIAAWNAANTDKTPIDVSEFANGAHMVYDGSAKDWYAVIGASHCGHNQFEHNEDCALQHDWTITGLNKPTCSTEGSRGWICYDCGSAWHEYLPKLEHEWVEIDSADPTCKDEGYVLKECTACGETDRKIIPAISNDEIINKVYFWNDLVDTDGDGVKDTPYILTIHTGLQHELVDAGKELLNDGKYHLQIGGSCTVQSIYYVYCDDCDIGLFVTDGESGKGHKWIIDVQKDITAPTCFTAGSDGLRHCEFCGLEETITGSPALHTSNPNAVEKVAEVKPVCGGIGVKQHWKCDCMGYEKYYNKSNPTSEADVLTKEQHDALHFTLEHNWVEHCHGYQNCTEFAYVHYVCLNAGCKYGEVEGENGYYGVLTNGNPESEDFTNLEEGRALGHNKQDATCEEDAYCSRCDLVWEDTALGHKNAAGETLTTDCSDPAQQAITDRNCVNCKEGCAHWDAEKECGVINFVHDEYNVIRDGNCIEYACEITLCKKCHKQLKYHQGEKGDHEWKAVEGTASYTSQALERCIHCGAERYNSWTGVQFNVVADNANAAGFGFVDSSLVKLNISIESIEKVGVHTFRFDVTYDAENMYYVGFEAIFEDLFANVADNIKVMVNDNGKGTVTCLFVADNDEEGELQNIIVEKLELLNLFFRIKLTEENNAPSKMYMDATNKFNFAVTNVEILDANKKALEEGSETYGFAVDNAEICVEALGDTDNTGGRELSDVQRIYELFITGGYEIGADINQNGRIDLEDIQMAYQYAIYAIEYSDLWNCGVEDED